MAIVCTCLLTVSLMTVLQDDSISPSCPVAPLRDPQNGNTVIIVDDRSTELALMDNNLATCLVTLDQGHRFMRLLAYIYTPATVNSLRIQMVISGVLCTDPGLVVYHQITAGEHDDIQLHECALSTHSAIVTIKQECGFDCHKVSPENSVVRVYVQVEKWIQKDILPVHICDMSVASVYVWKLRSNAGDMKIGQFFLSRI